MTHVELVLPVYEQQVLFISHHEEYKAVNKLIKKITGIDIEHSGDESGLTAHIKVIPKIGPHSTLVIICNSSDKHETLYILAHELFHATVTVCEYLNICVTEDSGQEAGAYIQGWLFKSIFESVLERKMK